MLKLSLRAHPGLQLGRLILLAVLALLAAVTGVPAVSHAQTTPTPAMATLTGTAYRLVDQTIVDGVVVDETEEPIMDGRIAIPELGIDMPLAADGTFALSNLPVSADPDNPTEVTVIFTAPGLGSYTYLHLRLFPGTVGPIPTPQLIDTPRVNDLNRAHFHDDSMRAFPVTGGGGPATGSGLPVAPALLALVGAALVFAGTAARRMRKAR